MNITYASGYVKTLEASVFRSNISRLNQQVWVKDTFWLMQGEYSEYSFRTHSPPPPLSPFRFFAT